MNVFDNLRSLFNRAGNTKRLRQTQAVAALRCIAHGWPVLPGAWWSPQAQRHVCDIPGCLSAALHPAAIEQDSVSPLIPPTDLAKYALTDRRQVLNRWSKYPYAVLVPTGIACDAVEVPTALQEKVLAATNAAEVEAPIARLDNSLIIFVSPDSTISDIQLAELTTIGILLHQKGSWVAIPPTIVDGIETTWLTSPSSAHWNLPPADTILKHLTSG